MHVHRAQQRVDLSIEAGVSEAESEAPGHRQNRRRGDVRWAIGVGERRVVGQIQENGNEGEQVHAESGDHHRPHAADTGHLGAADAKDGAADHLPNPDEDPGEANQALTILAQRFGKSNTGRIDARVERQQQSSVEEHQRQQKHPRCNEKRERIGQSVPRSQQWFLPRRLWYSKFLVSAGNTFRLP